MFEHMFHLPVPLLEKILRPIIVYIVLVLLLRIFGKRELAQLNPFDLVVLLSLSNTVQNALIGDDNSVTGGIIGAVTLLGINWLVVRMLFARPKLEQALEGTERLLILNGHVDHEALKKETMTETELLSVLHRQGFDDFASVKKCVLEPNGGFFIEGFTPSGDEVRQADLVKRLEVLTSELRELKAELGRRNS
jgi:uncharacterized membrane protein YcaP (DUF421 family)